MKYEKAEVMNFEGAFRGMRNPLESWDKSDSFFGVINADYNIWPIDDVIDSWVFKKLGEEGRGSDEWYKLEDFYFDWLYNNGALKLSKYDDSMQVVFLGPNDIDLAQRLIKAGPEHCKFLRQIFVSLDITAPLYWWKEFDTYKIGTTANSTSTMHKLASTPITKDCFEMDDFNEDMLAYQDHPSNPDIYMSEYWDMLINDLEYFRKKYNETKDQRYWKELIRLLPESWLQTRTVTMSYANLRNIYNQRKNHKLTEWHTFCSWVEKLPYAKELITYKLDE